MLHNSDLMNNHALHGVLLGFGLHYFAGMKMKHAVLIGGGAAAYMLMYEHNLPF